MSSTLTSLPIGHKPFEYLAGTAGVGKTTMARALAQDPGVALCATTGIAAVNLGEGTTINALLKYFDTAQLEDMYLRGRLQARLRALRRTGTTRILIDEISMMDARQLTALTRAISEVNEGKTLEDVGVNEQASYADAPQIGITLVGDFAQLPPVNAPFAFESPEWGVYQRNMVKLTKVMRQDEPAFIQALHDIRNGQIVQALQFFTQDRFVNLVDPHYEGSTIMAKNDEVSRYNQLRLDQLLAPVIDVKSARWGKERPEWKDIPATLQIKVGALVMILANKRVYDDEDDEIGRIVYANGDLGYVVAIIDSAVVIELIRTRSNVVVDYLIRQNLQPLEPGRREELKASGNERLIVDKQEIVGEVTYMPLRVAYATTVHKCVTGETRIPIIGRGYVPIADVVAHEMTPYGQVQRVVQTMEPAYRVTTARGYSVVCSAEHRWQTREIPFVRTQDLDTDDLVLHAGIPFPGESEIAEYTLWWLGMTVGDGSYTDRKEGQIHLACMDRELGDRYKEIGEVAFSINIAWRKDKRGLYLTSLGTRTKLAGWGLDYVKGPYKRIPWCVWTEGPAGRAAFLRGLFDADGFVGRNRVVLTTASEQMGRDVQELLLTLGVISTRRHYRGPGLGYWQVYVGAESLDEFARWIGFWKADKALKMTKARPNRVLRPSLGYDKVVSVEPLGLTVPMYDIEIMAPHVLPFGPFLGHNSQGLTLDRVQIDLSSGFFRQPGMLFVALSRAKTAAGLRIVGNQAMMVQRVRYDPKVRPYL